MGCDSQFDDLYERPESDAAKAERLALHARQTKLKNAGWVVRSMAVSTYTSKDFWKCPVEKAIVEFEDIEVHEAWHARLEAPYREPAIGSAKHRGTMEYFATH